MSNAWEGHSYHPTAEAIVDLLRTRTQNTKSDLFFRVVTSYFIAQMAASMRASVDSQGMGDIPINTYACALMTSGGGKNLSINVLENEIVNQFSDMFTKVTFPTVSLEAMEEEAVEKANQTGNAYEEELKTLKREFGSLGAMPYSFSESSSPAYKQVRQKAQIAKCGAMNLIIDEIGSMLSAASEVLTVNLETYDVGLVKDKLTKASSDNVRHEQRFDAVPSNMLVFGTPAKVFDGAKTEQEFIALNETGYARRFLFGWGDKGTQQEYTAEELYDLLSNSVSCGVADKIAADFAKLADPLFINQKIILERDEGILLLKYRLQCEKEAELLPEHEHIRKAEMQHRYFKAMKLAGAYAFIDQTYNITEKQLYAAIKVVEDSAVAFKKIMSRPKAYARLAKYLAEVNSEVTQADLTEALPFYRGSVSVKSDMLALAQAWGYTHNIVIKRYEVNGIEFLSGEALKENTMQEMRVSYSNHEAYRYQNAVATWDKLSKLFTRTGLHWVNHHVEDAHRKEDAIVPGFNMVVIDCDGGVSINAAQDVLKEYKAIFYTTKRHTAQEHRFRIVIPLKYELHLDAADYSEFMKNIHDWLPFKVDDSTGQRSRKWLSNAGTITHQDGIMLDPLAFIPKTAKNETRKKENKAMGSMDSTRRWFAKKMVEGNRNNLFIRYALMLKDSGMPFVNVEKNILQFNKQLADPLPDDELRQTVLKSIAGRYK